MSRSIGEATERHISYAPMKALLTTSALFGSSMLALVLGLVSTATRLGILELATLVRCVLVVLMVVAVGVMDENNVCQEHTVVI